MSLDPQAVWLKLGEFPPTYVPGSHEPTTANLSQLKAGDFIKVGLTWPNRAANGREVFWAIIESTGTLIHAKVNNDLILDWGIDDGDPIIVSPENVLLIFKG